MASQGWHSQNLLRDFRGRIRCNLDPQSERESLSGGSKSNALSNVSTSGILDSPHPDLLKRRRSAEEPGACSRKRHGQGFKALTRPLRPASSFSWAAATNGDVPTS